MASKTVPEINSSELDTRSIGLSVCYWQKENLELRQHAAVKQSSSVVSQKLCRILNLRPLPGFQDGQKISGTAL